MPDVTFAPTYEYAEYALAMGAERISTYTDGITAPEQCNWGSQAAFDNFAEQLAVNLSCVELE